MKRPAAERFWEKVDKTAGCWLWTGALVSNGYGQFIADTSANKNLKAHRFAYELLVGPVPAGLQLDHLCRNRRCVNPDHLEPVTQRENLLRGDTITARNAAKTHCPKGHPLSGDNLSARKNGGRNCRACDTERLARLHQKRISLA